MSVELYHIIVSILYLPVFVVTFNALLLLLASIKLDVEVLALVGEVCDCKKLWLDLTTEL